MTKKQILKEEDKVYLDYKTIKKMARKEAMEEIKSKLNKIKTAIKARLKYCQKYNGLPYCKNCGLNLSDIADLK